MLVTPIFKRHNIRTVHSFGKLSTLLRLFMNKIRTEDNRTFKNQEIETLSESPKNPQEHEKTFITGQQTKSTMEKNRMERIDQILGTKTYFHQTKLYQKRINSDHVMSIQMLKEKHMGPTRQELNWENPQIAPTYKIKNKRKFYRNIIKLRQYPQHANKPQTFQDQEDQQLMQFLAQEALYTRLSMNLAQLAAKSIMEEVIPIQGANFGLQIFQMFNYSYFKPQIQMALYRTQKSVFQPSKLYSSSKFEDFPYEVTTVLILDELYDLLQQYDRDERVFEYLKQIQNGGIVSLFANIKCNKQENRFAFTIDLTGNKKEYCLVYKNLAKEGLSSLVVFNLKPKVCFGRDNSIYFVQRSEEGGYTELVQYFPDQKRLEIIYKCDPHLEMQLDSDSNGDYVFLSTFLYKSNSQFKLYAVEPNERKNQILEQEKIHSHMLLEIASDQNARLKVDVCPKGLLLFRFNSTDDNYLLYGSENEYCDEVSLFPYKQYLAPLHQQQRIKLNQLTHISLNEFNLVQPQTVFKCQEGTYIKEASSRQTHLVLNLRRFGIYNRSRLLFHPWKNSQATHSLFLENKNLQLWKAGREYSSQVVRFKHKDCFIQTECQYTIWKQELQELSNQRVVVQRIIVNESVNLKMAYLGKFIEEEEFPVIIYFPSKNEPIDNEILLKILEKGVMFIEFQGRGTLTQRLQHFLQGARHNFLNCIADLQTAIKWVGENIGHNISIYSKGGYSSYLTLVLSIKYPFLLNSVALHDGIYDLSDIKQLSLNREFFGDVKENEEEKQTLAFWAPMNPFNWKFKAIQKEEIEIQAKKEKLEEKYEQYRQRIARQEQDIKPDEELEQQLGSRTQQDTKQSNQQNKAKPKKQHAPKKVKSAEGLMAAKTAPIQLQIGTLQHILVSCSFENRVHSRKLINFLRSNKSIQYQQVYLSEKIAGEPEDLLNLAYIYQRIRDRLERQQM